MKLGLIALLCISLLANTCLAQEDDWDFEEQSYVSDPIRIGLGLVFIGIALICLAVTIYFFIKQSDVKFLVLFLLIFTLFRGCFTFIPDDKLLGYKGVWRLFLNLIPEMAYFLSFAFFFATWGNWLARSREGSITTGSGVMNALLDFFKDLTSSLKTKEGWIFILMLLSTLLFTLLAFIVGANVMIVNISIYFSACLGVVGSGLAATVCSLFGVLYSKKSLYAIGFSVIPFVRMILNFVIAVRSQRFGDSIETVSATYCALVIIFEVVPVLILLGLSFVLHRKLSNTNTYAEPMLTNTDDDN